MPLKKLSKKEYKRCYKLWITNGILNSTTRKNKLYNRYSKTKDVESKPQMFEEYKSLRNTINELLRKSKTSYYKSFFTEHNNNIKKVWEGIKEIVVSIKSKNINNPTSIQVNNSIITDPIVICNNFNDYFVNLADNILNNRKYNGKKHYSEYLDNPNPNTFLFHPCDSVEVENLINDLNISKASGPNGIPTKILHMISSEISLPLSTIFNIAIITGTHPDKLKLVNAIPVFKKGTRLEISNYRSISLLSHLNKILEKILYKRINSFIEKNESLYSL